MDPTAVMRLIDAANEARRRRHLELVSSNAAESELERSFQVSGRLAVYGTLAPGRSNHHVLQPFGGWWSRGRVRGELVEFGWGAAAGYPALLLRADGPWVRVHVLESPRLRGAWSGIDTFEGSEYVRVLAPVFAEHGGATEIMTVANLYEIARRVGG